MNIENDTKVMEIAKKIKLCYPEKRTFWEYYSRITMEDVENDFFGYDDYKEQLRAKEVLLKVVKKCLMDDFPILEYSVFDIEGGITLVNTIDYEMFHRDKIAGNIKVVYFPYTYIAHLAIPTSIDGNIKYENCFDALDN